MLFDKGIVLCLYGHGSFLPCLGKTLLFKAMLMAKSHSPLLFINSLKFKS